MPQAALSRVAPAPFRSLPFEVEHKSSRTTAVVLMALLVPALAMVVLPVGMILTFASHDLWDAATHKPLPVLILGGGIVAWVAMLVVSAKRLVQHFGSRRRVTIAQDRVIVDDSNWFGSSQWSAPLAEFSGIAHHVRATLSGVRHELVLVHTAGDRSVLLYAAQAIPQSMIDQASHMFRLPQVEAHPLMRLMQRGLESSVVEALPAAQTA
jgi:hypothetical protein